MSGWQLPLAVQIRLARGGDHMEDLSVRPQPVAVGHGTPPRSMESASLMSSRRAAVMLSAASSVIEDTGGTFPYDAVHRPAVSGGKQHADWSGAVEIYLLSMVL